MSDVRLHIEASGAGRWLVFAHGFGGSARNFRPQVKAFSAGHHVVTYDARGHARSDAPDDPAAYEFERLVDDYERVASGSDEPIVAGGLSLGAATALGFALRRKERIRALVLASPPGGSDDPERRDWALGFARAIDESGLDAAGAEYAWGGRARFDPKGAALIRAGLMEHSPAALSRILSRSLAALPGPTSLAPELRAFDRPVLVVTGSEDRSAAAPARALVTHLPDAELVEIPGAGHVVNLAAAEAFNEACRRFLSRVDPPGAP